MNHDGNGLDLHYDTPTNGIYYLFESKAKSFTPSWS